MRARETAVRACVPHACAEAEALRERQIVRVMAHARAAFNEGLPHVLCGDLNSYDARDMSDEQWDELHALCARKGWGAPPAHSLVQRALSDGGFTDSFAAAAPSFSAESPNAQRPSEASAGGRTGTPPPTCWIGARLDYIMLSPAAARELRVRAHETIASDASDHLPVVCDLELPDEASLQWPVRR
jgi:endonuclease/exonuclease/phosphatase family metal-dependent hydrolase